MAAPGHALFVGQENFDFGGRANLALHHRDRFDLALVPGFERGKPFAKPLRVRQRGRKRGALHIGRDGLKAREGQRQQVAALAGREGMHFVDHDALQPGEHGETVGIAQQQREAFGRGQQHMRRFGTLALFAIGRRIAATRLDADGQAHLLDRRDEIALHVMRQRLERGDVECVQPAGRLRLSQP